MTGSPARSRLAELYAKVDGFFDRVASRHPGDDGITCKSGCTDCCRRRFTVTAIEAEVIAEGLAALPDEARSTLSARAVRGDPEVCPALDPDGRCAIYASRPVICRSHGLPIRFADPARSLPILDACPRNFQGRDLASIEPSSVLDQATVSTVLGAIDAARAAETERPRGERVAIAAVLAAT